MKNSMRINQEIQKEFVYEKSLEQKDHISSSFKLLEKDVNGLNKDIQKVFECV